MEARSRNHYCRAQAVSVTHIPSQAKNQKPNQKPKTKSQKPSQAKVLTGGRRLALLVRSTSRRPSVCQPLLRLTALLGSVTDA